MFNSKNMLATQIVIFISVSSILWLVCDSVDDKNWDLLYLLKKEKGISLTNEFTMLLKSSSNYSKMVLSPKSLFPANKLPEILLIILKLKFLNRIKFPGTIFNIVDPDNEERLSLTIKANPGIIDKVTLTILYHPMNGEKITRDIILPFGKMTIWTFALSLTESKIIVYTSCVDTKRPFGYQFIEKEPHTRKQFFKDGAVMNLFHDGHGNQKFKGEVFELIFSNHDGNLLFLCPKPMIDGSGSKKMKLENEKIGNVLLNPEKELRDFSDNSDNVLSDEMITGGVDVTASTSALNKATDSTKGKPLLINDTSPVNVTVSIIESSSGNQSNFEMKTTGTDSAMPKTHINIGNTYSVPGITSTPPDVSISSSLSSEMIISSTGSNNKTNYSTNINNSIINISNDPITSLTKSATESYNGVSEKTIKFVTDGNNASSVQIKTVSSTKSHGTEMADIKTTAPITTSRIIYDDTSPATVGVSSTKTTPTTPIILSTDSSILNRDKGITSSEINNNTRKEMPRSSLDIVKDDRNRTADIGYGGTEYQRCKAYMDQLLSMDNCEELKQLRLTIPRTGEKGEKGAAGERGKKGEVGARGVNGTCDMTTCQLTNNQVSTKGDKGDPGMCKENLCTSVKGDKGSTGDNGSKGVKGEMGSSNDINIELIRHLVSAMIPTEIEGLMRNVKGAKGEPGECKTNNQNYRKSNNGARRDFQENINIGYGSLVFENRQALEKVSLHLPLGSMVFLLKSDTFLVKVDHLNNIWRSISLDSRAKDWELPVVQTTPKIESRAPIFLNGFSKRLYLVALAIPTLGDLKSTTYQPGGYSGASFQCQQNGDIFGYGRLMHPLLNTDMFNMKYVIHDMYKNIPIYNSRDQILSNDFSSLLSMKEELQNDILDFDRRSISDNVMSSCVWIGKDPIPEYRDYQQNAELKCNNWMSRHPLTQALVSTLKPAKPLLSDDNLKSRACSLQCHILCIQTEPHGQ